MVVETPTMSLFVITHTLLVSIVKVSVGWEGMEWETVGWRGVEQEQGRVLCIDRTQVVNSFYLPENPHKVKVKGVEMYLSHSLRVAMVRMGGGQ